MRIRVLSDLHLEFEPFEPPTVPADVVVLAGDIGNGTMGLDWARERYAGTPVVYVPGNHEYYERDVGEVDAALARAALRTGVKLLDRAQIVIAGVRFLGATLWTDFDLHGADARADAFDYARRYLADFRLIRDAAAAYTPEKARARHERDRAWLALALARPHDGPTVVVTHHLPSPDSVTRRWHGSALNPAFASDLRNLVARADLWIHGHTHDSVDFRDPASGCRVVCNPKGYYDENAAFRADFVCDI
jgi:3',5'-cyclic AMP phosphodiesterase CpdA